ncbi:MAG: hypothetical protein EBS34_11710 [Flavobacteriales bacterium]|nr:hypothetical protein [Flavobacteriales bacterium]
MDKLFEKAYYDEISSKDGGFIFQAILNYDLSWSIIDGETSLDQKNIQGKLNQVDIFPDMRFSEGHATLTYVILSEVNLLKRKFELASEAIKRLLNPNYAKEMDGLPVEDESDELPKVVDTDLTDDDWNNLLPAGPNDLPGLPEPQKRLAVGQLKLGPGQKQLSVGQRTLPAPQKQLPSPASESKINEVLFTTKLTSAQIKEINDKYFKNTRYDVRFTVDRMVLREVSTSGLDTGSPNVTLKLSTGMVDTLDGKAINSWNGFKVKVVGKNTLLNNQSLTINNETDPKISEILVYDPIENINELIFRTILPSLVLEFKGDRVQIDNYSNRSSQVSIRSNIDFDNLFNIEEAPQSEIIDMEEGEEGSAQEKEDDQKKDDKNINSSLNK